MQRVALMLYGIAMLGFGATQDVRVLAVGIVVCALVAGRRAPRVLRRALGAVAVFTLTVSASMVVAGLLRDGVDTGWLLRTNLRVLLMTSCTFVVVERVDLARAFAPWPGLLTLMTVAGAQIRLLQRELDDLKLGLRSRSLRRPGTRTLAHHAASGGAQFLGRALHDAEEISLAMQARGAWHVRGE